MPGIHHQSVEELRKTVADDLELGIRAVLLFGVPDEADKSPDGRAASAPENPPWPIISPHSASR